jgi:hypothetical protein
VRCCTGRSPRCLPFIPLTALDRVSNGRATIVDRRAVAMGAPGGHTRRMTIPAPLSRLTLIPEPRAETPGATVVRRYHLSRLRLSGRPSPERHSHYKRTYD